MSAGLSVYADCLDEVAEAFIGRMLAPGDSGEELIQCLKRPWWKTGVGAGLACGVAVGLLAFFMIQGSSRLPCPKPVAASGAALAGVGRPELPPPSVVVAEWSREPAERKDLSRRLRQLKRRAGGRTGGNARATSRRMLSLGWRRYHAGKYQKASVAFARAVHLNPNATSGYFGLAISLFEQGHDEVALQVLEKGAGKKGGKAGAWVLLGAFYQWLGKESMAREMYRRYLREQPSGAFARDVRSLLARESLPVLSFPDIDD
jgi:hypothetical protein